MNNTKITAPIVEIFSSIQGEGLLIGERQIFVRFAGCNLKCDYCDTDWEINETTKIMTTKDVIKYIKTELDFDYDLHKTVVFTGGEPLLQAGFIKEIADEIHNDLQMNIMLETNGTLPQNLLEVISFIDIVSTDFKFQKYLSSVETCHGMSLQETEFLKILMTYGKDFYIKLVCDEKLSLEEFKSAIELIHEVAFDAIIVIQPIMRMTSGKLEYSKRFDEFFKIALKKFKAKHGELGGDVLFLPQIHKFLGIK